MEHSVTASVLFVGTVHGDPEGFRKSLSLFERVRPDSILVELSPFGYRYRRKNRRRLRKILRCNLRKAAKYHGISLAHARTNPQIVSIFNQISLPFEYRAAASYSKKRSVEIALVDSSIFSRECIAGWAELISVGNLQTLLGLPLELTSMNETYQLAGRTVAASENSAGRLPAMKGAEEIEFWAERERLMASRIKHKIAQRLPERAIYIGGWWHLTCGTTIPTLRDLLALESSQCRLLDGA